MNKEIPIFNTLKYAKILQEAGFSREQSEAAVHILAEVMEDKLATKHDIQELAVSTKRDIQQLKSDLIIKMGAMQAAAVGLVVALLKLL